MSQGEKSLQKEMQLYYQKALAEGKTRRQAKKFVRVLTMGHKIPFSKYEQADRNREAKEAKKKEEEAKKQQEIESKLEAIAETVQLPKMNAVEPEAQPKKEHPKKSPKSPRKHPRSFYHTKPDESSATMPDPPTPITE